MPRIPGPVRTRDPLLLVALAACATAGCAADSGPGGDPAGGVAPAYFGSGGGKADGTTAGDDDDRRLPCYFGSGATLYAADGAGAGLEPVGCGPETGLVDRVRRVCVDEATGRGEPCRAGLRVMELLEITDPAECGGRALVPGERFLADLLAVSPLVERVTPRARVTLYDRDLAPAGCATPADVGLKVDELFPLETGPDGRRRPRTMPDGQAWGHVEGMVFLEPHACDGAALAVRTPYYVRKAEVEIDSPAWPDDPGAPRWSSITASGDGCPAATVELPAAGANLTPVFSAFGVERRDDPDHGSAHASRTCTVAAEVTIAPGYRVASLGAGLTISYELGAETALRATLALEAGGAAFAPLHLEMERTGPAEEAYASAGDARGPLEGCAGGTLSLRYVVTLDARASVAATEVRGPGVFFAELDGAELTLLTEACPSPGG